MNILSIEDRYFAFSSEIHAEGSNTAPSYVKALKKLIPRYIFIAPYYLRMNQCGIFGMWNAWQLYMNLLRMNRKKMTAAFSAMNLLKVIGERASVQLQ